MSLPKKRHGKTQSNSNKKRKRIIDRVKQRFVLEGLDAALGVAPTSRVYTKKMAGEAEARLISIAYCKPPKGFGKWSLRLLTDRIIELNYVDNISCETVREVKKKLKSWKVKGWVIPSQQNSHFVSAIEQVLNIYKRPYDKSNPVVCMDETPEQLINQRTR